MTLLKNIILIKEMPMDWQIPCLQTAFLRPKLKSKKVNNLYFTGQLTVPGPGVPPSLISGKLVSELITKN
jgi:phytoene dehydrogenase-like protein